MKTVTAKLICGFVFAQAKNRFSHGVAHMKGCKVVFQLSIAYQDRYVIFRSTVT